MEQNHTPTPWNAKSFRIAMHDAMRKIYSAETTQANIAFIVHAVNCHADLLALAEHVAAMADDAYLTGHPEWMAIVDEARAAIAKATRPE